ncbi:MAG TPA: PadR family transcriptional regulator [Gemmatimonadaceae bacterium]|nr:PadR family transcriptional regulator [Gemmatimonadaceae bacterium]
MTKERATPRHAPLATLSYYVLLALAERPAHGWAIIKRIRELTDDASNPSSGSLYLAMARLEDDDLIVKTTAPPNEDERRGYYKLTAAGRQAAREESQRLSRLVRHARSLDLLGESR